VKGSIHAMKIITQNTTNSEELSTNISHFYHSFELSKIARLSNFFKCKGFSFQTLFCYLMSVIFSNQSAFRDYQAKGEDLGFSDKTFRNFLNDGRINWQKFLVSLSQKVINYFDALTSENRETVFIVDDSMYARPNGKKVELSAKQFDHAKHSYTRGFRFLTLGWSDGNSFLPVNFSLLSGQSERVAPKSLDPRSNSGKRKTQALRSGTDVTVELLQQALHAGCKADYVLFDSWFSSPKMFHRIHNLGLNVIAMVKKTTKVNYEFNGTLMNVKDIFKSQKKRRGRSRYLLSVKVNAIHDDKKLPLKLVFVRNRNKRNEYLVLASTNTELSEDEIIRLYGKRWAIEVFFKMCKQHLRLAKYRGISYDGIFAHCTLVATSYIFLALRQREEVDDRTIGELFYLTVQELSDITFADAICQLLSLFKDTFQENFILDESALNNKIEDFIPTLPIIVQKQLNCK
jgi:hypothetical protein